MPWVLPTQPPMIRTRWTIPSLSVTWLWVEQVPAFFRTCFFMHVFYDSMRRCG
jgi:hypothetical protein